jgi:hypothetical protein
MRRVCALDEHPLPHAVDIGKDLLCAAAPQRAVIPG